MERKVSVYPFPFGTRVFMHRNGVIREAIARLFELETARKVIKEMENKGVEL